MNQSGNAGGSAIGDRLCDLRGDTRKPVDWAAIKPSAARLKKAKIRVFKKATVVLRGAPIRGPHFRDLPVLSYSQYLNTGFQSTSIAMAARIYQLALESRAHICLGFTSNAGTCGLRQLIASLIEKGMVQSVVCTVGAIQQDIMKTFSTFHRGAYRMNDAQLNRRSINRTGNILISNNAYVKLEKFMRTTMESWGSNSMVVSEFLRYIGSKLKDPASIVRQCYMKSTPLFCPAFLDGAVGDWAFFSQRKINIDVLQDHKRYNELLIDAGKTAVISLGGGVQKHYMCNANLIKGGANYAVYMNNSREYEGSNAGAPPQQAVSWGKILAETPTVKVYGDFTVNFPIAISILKGLLKGVS